MRSGHPEGFWLDAPIWPVSVKNYYIRVWSLFLSYHQLPTSGMSNPYRTSLHYLFYTICFQSLFLGICMDWTMFWLLTDDIHISSFYVLARSCFYIHIIIPNIMYTPVVNLRLCVPPKVCHLAVYAIVYNWPTYPDIVLCFYSTCIVILLILSVTILRLIFKKWRNACLLILMLKLFFPFYYLYFDKITHVSKISKFYSIQYLPCTHLPMYLFFWILYTCIYVPNYATLFLPSHSVQFIISSCNRQALLKQNFL